MSTSIYTRTGTVRGMDERSHRWSDPLTAYLPRSSRRYQHEEAGASSHFPAGGARAAHDAMLSAKTAAASPAPRSTAVALGRCCLGKGTT